MSEDSIDFKLVKAAGCYVERKKTGNATDLLPDNEIASLMEQLLKISCKHNFTTEDGVNRINAFEVRTELLDEDTKHLITPDFILETVRRAESTALFMRSSAASKCMEKMAHLNLGAMEKAITRTNKRAVTYALKAKVDKRLRLRDDPFTVQDYLIRFYFAAAQKEILAKKDALSTTEMDKDAYASFCSSVNRRSTLMKEISTNTALAAVKGNTTDAFKHAAQSLFYLTKTGNSFIPDSLPDKLKAIWKSDDTPPVQCERAVHLYRKLTEPDYSP
ncbi:MAG: hypothetical protein FWF24_07340 [Alphaproteobacteria bacterium]|nr:hypothetical protein [Alphaproteobacteria bacterium]